MTKQKRSDFILFSILILTLVGILFTSSTYTPLYIELSKQIKELKTDIQRNQRTIETYNSNIKSIKDSISALNYQIENNNRKIQSLKVLYNEKMDSIVKFSSSDIELYISNRYRNK